MARWFRLYAEVVNDPKVQKLPCEDFRAWVNLLCLASENDGKIPSFEDVAFALRMTPDGARTVVERLSNGGLIDRLSGGPDGWRYAPHGWAKRQYKSDTSTERVKRFRKRSETVSETPPETETDTELKKDTPTEYPKKKGSRLSDNWKPSDADNHFAMKEGLTPEETDREAANFRDYWCARTGRDACKLDWSATWRNRIRHVADYRKRQKPAAGPKANGNGSQPVSMAGILAERRRQASVSDDVPGDRWILRKGDGV